MFDQNLIVGLVVLAVIGFAVYAYYPTLRTVLSGKMSGLMREGFTAHASPFVNTPATNGSMGGNGMNSTRTAAQGGAHALNNGGSADGLASFGAEDGVGTVPMAAANKPQGCYPREQLNPNDLLPQDSAVSQWAQVNPKGAGDIQGKNFLSAGALIGVNTIGQSLRNANLQLRAEPPCPQVKVGPWMQSTIEPDLNRRPLE